MADYDDFDLDRSTSQAWQQFGERLSEVISMIDPGGSLWVGTMSSNDDQSPFLTFSCSDAEDHNVLLAQASSNEELGDRFQLTTAQLADMGELGWIAPNHACEGRGNRLQFLASQEQSGLMADLAVRTLRDVFGVQHPVFLAPDQLAEVLQCSAEPLLESRADRDQGCLTPRDQRELDALVTRELRSLFGHEPLRDEVGDVAIRVGSTVVFVRSTPDARELVLFAVLVHDVDGRSRAMEVINDLNVESRFGRFALHRDKVFVSMSLLVPPFVPEHLAEGLRTISRLADAIDDRLADRLRGRTTFPTAE